MTLTTPAANPERHERQHDPRRRAEILVGHPAEAHADRDADDELGHRPHRKTGGRSLGRVGSLCAFALAQAVFSRFSRSLSRSSDVFMIPLENGWPRRKRPLKIARTIEFGRKRVKKRHARFQAVDLHGFSARRMTMRRFARGDCRQGLQKSDALDAVRGSA